ncbi:MAG: TIGR00730 family Rossman fold protein [Burkholderiales bacterium]|nr:TIGR00730 family Rossman fold protein [Burkholderiales bacterium]
MTVHNESTKAKIEHLKSAMSATDLTPGQEAWRALQIMSEFVYATEKLRPVKPAVSIFGSARIQADNPWYDRTVAIARLLSDSGFSVISGGGPGIMEAANVGAFAGKSLSIGLNIQLPHEQHGNPFQDMGISFKYFFNRKLAFVRSSAALVCMPGGFGTLDELTEALTLIQTGKARRMPIILVGKEFWGGMHDWMRSTLLRDKLISPGDIELMQILEEPQEIVDVIFDSYEREGIAPTKQQRQQILAL